MKHLEKMIEKILKKNWHIVIRVFDLAGGLDIDLEVEIIKKMTKNTSRPYKHGKTF